MAVDEEEADAKAAEETVEPEEEVGEDEIVEGGIVDVEGKETGILMAEEGIAGVEAAKAGRIKRIATVDEMREIEVTVAGGTGAEKALHPI